MTFQKREGVAREVVLEEPAGERIGRERIGRPLGRGEQKRASPGESGVGEGEVQLEERAEVGGERWLGEKLVKRGRVAQMAGREQKSMEPRLAIRRARCIEEATTGEALDGGEIPSGEESAKPRLGGLGAAVGVVAEEALVGGIGQVGLADLPELGEEHAGGVVTGVDVVGDGEGKEGVLDVAVGLGGAGLFEEKRGTRLGDPMPRRGPGDIPIRDAVADAAQQSEGGEADEQREKNGGGGKQSERAEPKRTDIPRID